MLVFSIVVLVHQPLKRLLPENLGWPQAGPECRMAPGFQASHPKISLWMARVQAPMKSSTVGWKPAVFPVNLSLGLPFHQSLSPNKWRLSRKKWPSLPHILDLIHGCIIFKPLISCGIFRIRQGITIWSHILVNKSKNQTYSLDRFPTWWIYHWEDGNKSPALCVSK